MSTLAQLRSSMKNLDDQVKKLDEGQKKSYTADERYWQPTRDKLGNGFAVIRFLPPSQVDGTSAKLYVNLFHHGFKGPTGQWYIENSNTTIGGKDPCSEYNSKLWNTNVESNRQIARDQKRKLSYISNVLIVNDPAHPELNGQVKLFKYGKKIFAKIKEAMQPPFPDKQPINPFDFWEGANFKLKVRKGDGGFPNYDSSEFEAVSQIADGDEAELNRIWAASHSLNAEVAPDKFKTYDELKKRLDLVLGDGSTSAANDPVAALPTSTAPELPSRTSGPVSFDQTAATKKTDAPVDPSLADFQSLADED
jgi:hypothetical protein